MQSASDFVALIEARMEYRRAIDDKRDRLLIEACRSRDRWMNDLWLARRELHIAMRRIEILERLSDALTEALIKRLP